MKKKLLSVVAAALVAILTLAPLPGTALAQEQGETIATGFNGPLGILVDAQGNVWVVDSGLGGQDQFTMVQGEEEVSLTFGESAHVVRIAPDGSQTVVGTLPSLATPEGPAGGAHLAMLDGTLYVASSEWLGGIQADRPARAATVLALRDGEFVVLADTWAFEESQNPDGNQLHSHPYEIEAGPQGSYLWVTDAGANALLRVNPGSGEVSLVARFEALPSGLPEGQGPPQSEAVPTGLAFGRDGTAYVSLLPGFPFLPGSARVVRVTPEGEVSDYATGLTMITDLETGPDGELYAVSISQFTPQGPTPQVGKILRIRAGGASEVVVDGLSFPASIAFNEAGDAYVTMGVFGPPGSGSVVRFAGLIDMKGSPLPAPQSGAPVIGADAGSEDVPQTLPVTGAAPVPASWILAGVGALVVVAAGVLRTSRHIHARASIRQE